MKTPPASLLLLCVCVLLLSGLTLSAVSLDVRPNLQQFFAGDSVSLSCDQQTGGQTVKRTRGGQMDQCGPGGFGLFNGSSCFIPFLSQSDSGVYWCETSSGQRSLQVDIRVTRGHLILEIPALPVMTGSDVTLRCRDTDMKIEEAYFFRSGTRLGSLPVRGNTLSGVRQSDEVLYWCSTGLVGKSPEGWLRVKGPPSAPPPPPPPTSPPPPSSSCLVRVLIHLMVFCPFFVSTGLMLSIYCIRDMGQKAAVSTEKERSAGGAQGLEEDYDDVTTDVTTVHEF